MKRVPTKRAPSAPICVSFSDEPSVRAFERDVRVHRAAVEALRIAMGDRTGSFVVSGASGGTYFVDLVDRAGVTAACSCPDFLFAMLGTCKHVEAVRRATREDARIRRAAKRLPPLASAEAGVVLTARSDGRLRLVAVGALVDPWSARVGVSLGPDGEVLSPLAVDRLRDPAELGARVTHAAIAAGRILEQRRDRAVRSGAIGEALLRGDLGVDVLSAPLFPYQKEGVAHLVRAGRAVLADDMGLGKTVQTIAACEVLRRRGEAKRILIVCPASLKAQWASEIARYAGAQAVVIVGGVEARRSAFASDAPYVVLNYELTWRDLSLLKNLDADVLVLDEAQRAKNFRTKTAATLKSIPSRFLFVLTGTPVENRLDDLYGILQLVDGEVLGPLWKFNLDFHDRDENGKIVAYRNLGGLRRAIAPVVLRRRKEAVLSQLPALTEQTRYVAMSAEQSELDRSYRGTAARLIQIAAKRPLNPAEQKRLLSSLLKARQACNAAVLCDPETTERVPAKIDELGALVTEIAQQGTSKVLVFSEWTEMLKLAADRLDALGIGHLTLHGGVATAARPALIERFRNDDDKVVLLSTDAGGVGLNLQVASYVIHLDLPWNPGRLDQRIARAHRLGQTRGVSVTYLCAETGIERGIEGTLAGKRAVRHATEASSEVEELDAPSFTMFLREARAVLGDLPETDGEEAPAAREPVLASLAPLPAASPPRPDAEGSTQAVRRPPRQLHGAAAFARQRLRLAHVVLDAGFYGDAVEAAYEAIAASLRGRVTTPIDDSHHALIAAVYAELLPSGGIPSTLPGVIARIHDLACLAQQGIAIDAAIAKSAVDDASAWLDRDDAFTVDEERTKWSAKASAPS